MKKKKGMSLEDKRQILLSLFKNDHSFFHYKEIEKHCTQHKINFMIVKDLLQGILADNLVETEKIGSSSFYWSLPTRVLAAKKNTLKRENERKETINSDIENTNKKIQECKNLRKNSDRQQKLDELDDYLKKKEEYDKIIKGFRKFDPERYEKLINENKSYVQLYDNWADNIYTLEQWLRTKRPDVKIIDMFPELKELHLFDEDE